MDLVNLDEVETLAQKVLPKMAFDYHASGADSQTTVDKNRRAFKQLSLVPRTLVDVSRVDMRCSLPGIALLRLLLPQSLQF
jgi:isopentenyl diphosphate isomerase/L-lactate dehydrogenase-like FMN-dependent dehydrogenase